MQALAATVAAQLGVIGTADAQQIVTKTADILLSLPRLHGILPHFVRSNGAGYEIAPGAEWASIDTLIAWEALLLAQQSLGLDTTRSSRPSATSTGSDPTA